ncbi:MULTISPECIES: CidA/LrgA family protein [unclassified Nocardioides]|uniref:CidA/LrgA family protein n=1 Tax=unclassified Nocardioides TaxID=2615069 RepID=UPI003014CF6B
MITGLTWLLGCQLVGEVLVRLTDAPVPGPVVGMVVLFVVLQVRRAADDVPVVRVSDALLRHLQLLFVPAGAGVVGYLSVLREDALPVTVALVGSWVLGLAVVGWTVSLLGGRDR